MNDSISRQDAINLLKKWSDGYSWLEVETDFAIEEFKGLPSAQSTLYGYNIEYLELIAKILQKENLPPEKVIEALTNIDRIIAIVRGEFEEVLRKAVEQCMI